MCGLVVATGTDARKRVERALPLIAHRGPDEQGLFADDRNPVALGAARLSIIDLTGGHQPMISASGRFVLAWNGEVFNAGELRRCLELDGVRFVTDHSDTELVLEGFAHEGSSFFSRLNGMFAVAIWDRQERLLTLARDPFGIKPLFLDRRRGQVAAASETHALLTVTGESPVLDAAALRAYLDLGYVPGTRVGLEGIEGLEPGTWLCLDVEGTTVTRGRMVWEGPLPERNATLEGAAKAVRDGLVDAVGRWSTSDVPVALSLSGGLDSSAILASAAMAGVPVSQTYTAFFADINHPENAEVEIAAATAARFGVAHTAVPIRERDVLDSFWRIVQSLGQPYGGSIPSWFLYESVSKDFKVCLTGTGGDELFGQYGKWVPIAERVLGSVPKDASGHPRKRARYALKRAAYRLGRAALPGSTRMSLARQFARSDSWIDAYPLADFEYSFRSAEAPTRKQVMLEGLAEEVPEDGLARWQACLEFRTQLPAEFLMVTDRLSMANSVEARVPFLDQELVSMVQLLPDSVRLTQSDPKWLLRRAFERELPVEVLSAPKMGFTDPVSELLKGTLAPLAEEVVRGANLEIVESLGINRSAVLSWFASDRRDHALSIWRLVMVLAWWRTLQVREAA